MRTSFIYVLVLGFMLSCTSSKMHTPAEIEALKSLVNSKSFEFTADWANPMVTQSLTSVANSGLIPPGSTVSRINLAGNPNYIKVIGDSVSANLPYYGERQFGGGYGSASGIEFNGIADDYLQRYDVDKGKYNIRFKIKNNTEQYTIMMEVYPSNTANVSVNTSNRLSIRYDGIIKAFENTKKE